MASVLREGRLLSKVLLKREEDKCCNSCGKTDIPLLKCTRCKVALFCSKQCQKTAWPSHKTECAELATKKQEMKDILVHVKQETGKSKTEQTKTYREIVSKIESMPGFAQALRSVAHMVSTGKFFPLTGINKPSHLLFVINMSAWDAFATSNSESIRRTFIVTAYPPTILQKIINNDDLFAKVTELQAKTPCMGAFLWQAKHDRSEGSFPFTTINIMPYDGSAYQLEKAGFDSSDPGFLPPLKANHMRNCLVSQYLSSSVVLVPPPEVSEIFIATSPPKWDVLAKNRAFQSLVEQKSFGAIGAYNDGSERNAVTLFVNASNMNSLIDCIRAEIDRQLPGNEIERMVKERMEAEASNR